MNNDPLCKINRPYYSISVYTNRVQVTDRTGCLGIGMLIPRRYIIPIRKIANVEAGPLNLTIQTDEKTYRYSLAGVDGAAAQVRDAILSVM